MYITNDYDIYFHFCSQFRLIDGPSCTFTDLFGSCYMVLSDCITSSQLLVAALQQITNLIL